MANGLLDAVAGEVNCCSDVLGGEVHCKLLAGDEKAVDSLVLAMQEEA